MIAPRVVLIAVFFAVFSSLLMLAGDPQSPAYPILNGLEKTPHLAIVGDSRPHTGISPTRITSELNTLGLPDVRSYNFAVDGTDVLHSYSFVINGLLQRKPVPKVIVWGTNPLQFDGSRPNNRLEQLDLNDVPALWRAGAPIETILDVVTMAYFRPWRQRPVFARVVSDYSERAAIRTLPIQTRLLGLSHAAEVKSRVYTKRDDGQEPFEILDWKDRFDRGAAAYIKDYEKLVLSAWHIEIARLLAKQVREAGSKLIILEMPVAPWFQSHLAPHPKHAKWRDEITKIATHEGALFLNHAALYTDSDSKFGDPAHMPAVTADEYSIKLARTMFENKEISNALSAPRKIGRR